MLSPGEQQRVAFARVLLSKPSVVFLDEATSALDEGQEFALYKLLRAELPDSIVVSISHRSAVGQHHAAQLELPGDGPWRLSASEPTRRSSGTAACAPARRPKNEPSPSWVPLA